MNYEDIPRQFGITILFCKEPLLDGGDWNIIGKHLLFQGRPAEALKSFDRSSIPFPGHGEAQKNRSCCLIILGRISEAGESYRTVLESDPYDAIRRHKLGHCFLSLREKERAVECWKKALACDLRDALSLNCPEAVLLENREWEKALPCFDQVIAVSPPFSEVWINRAEFLEELQDALRLFEQALAIELRNSRTWFLEQLERLPETLVCYEALQLDPEFAEAWQGKAQTEERLGRQRQAGYSCRNFLKYSGFRFPEQELWAAERLWGWS
ncbi:MAG TPA: tetratricopeptide repeat protein [Atribacteraceae bacterium]|nr:tetratricopeptide repeat protein [Atribacteraceae bacterium]